LEICSLAQHHIDPSTWQELSNNGLWIKQTTNHHHHKLEQGYFKKKNKLEQGVKLVFCFGGASS